MKNEGSDLDMIRLPPSEIGKLDKDERIKLRRKRVESKIHSQRGRNMIDDGIGGGIGSRQGPGGGLSSSHQQVINSKHRLDKLKSEGSDLVSSIRVRTEQDENDRRLNETTGLQRRVERVQNENEVSTKRNAAVQMRWDSLYEYEVPQDLHEELEKQKDACSKIISSKDTLVIEMMQSLREKDQLYVDSLRKQEEDIDLMLQRMHKQTKDLMSAYDEELREIEESYLAERQLLLDRHRKEVEDLLERRRQAEQQYMEERQKRISQDQKQLDQLREQNAENFHVLKMRLQGEIQKLEQQLEAMRARYQLNQEKLDYNYRVLSERVVENQNTITQHKRKLARLQDVLSGIISKYNKSDKQYKQENSELTEAYKRITEQYKDLQIKLHRFQESDQEKFRQVWQMNEEKVLAMLYKLMEADRIIHEHHLGMAWEPPNAELYSALRDQYSTVVAPAMPDDEDSESEDGGNSGPSGPSGADAVGLGMGGGGVVARSSAASDASPAGSPAGRGGATNNASRNVSPQIENGTETSPSTRSGSPTNRLIESTRGVRSRSQIQSSDMPPNSPSSPTASLSSRRRSVSLSGNVLSPKPIRRGTERLLVHVLRMLSEEASFLLDDRVLRNLDSLTREEQEIAKADSILRSLGIESDTEAESILPYFIRDNVALQDATLDHLVSPEQVVTCLRRFVDNRKESASRRLSSQQNMALKTRLIREERSRKEQKAYWNGLQHALPENRYRVWNVLGKEMDKYRTLLLDRSDLIQETIALKEQNDELKGLLNQYLSADVNDHLYIPPAKTILEGLQRREQTRTGME